MQDLTIDSTVGRAQYSFILENANPAEFATWTPRLLERLRQMPALADVASNTQAQGQAVDLVVDRATAARFGITLASIDNALYDAFGQRIVSTIYTQSNQYRVILEVDPKLQRDHRRSVDALPSLVFLERPTGRCRFPRSSTSNSVRGLC